MSISLATSPAFIYNSAGVYVAEVDLPSGTTVEEAFEFAFTAMERESWARGEFGVEVRQESDEEVARRTRLI